MVATNSDDGSQLKFTHVHACIHCNHPRLREEAENREITSGILCANASHGDRIDGLQMARIRNQMQSYLSSRFILPLACCTNVIFHVSASENTARVDIFEFGGSRREIFR